MKKWIGIIAVFAALTAVFASPAYAGRKAGDPPAPKLTVPGDFVDLTGKNALEFRWTDAGGQTGPFVFDFRLYKGNQTVESGLILKKEISARESSVSIDASQFEDGQTYAWSMRTVGLRKSRSNYSIFKVKK
jgi:hypothetical protein